MSTVDDLLSQRRRGTLSEADERRLQIAVQTSREHELSLLAGAVFDREGAPQPGDAALVREIVRQVEGEWSGTFQRVVARRRLSRWVSLPVLVAGVAAASFGGYRGFELLRGPEQLAATPVSSLPAASSPAASLPAAPAQLAPEPSAAPSRIAAAPVAVPFEEPSSDPAPAPVPSAPVRAVTSGAERRAAVARRAMPAPAAAPASTAAPAPEAVAPEAVAAEPAETARELFRRASRLRQSDWNAAASLYEQLTQRFADSHEAGVAEMALAKHALAEGRSNEALRWFQAYQRRAGGELAAEALWGQAQALDNLGERPRAHALWRVLVEQYPASAYAAAAREQLGPPSSAQP